MLHVTQSLFKMSLTTAAQDHHDIVISLFLCRGEVNATLCQGCVVTAATNIRGHSMIKLREFRLTEKKISAGYVGLASSQTLYGMAQCVPDLPSDECDTCFRSAIAILPTCCNGSEGATCPLPLFGIYDILESNTVASGSATPLALLLCLFCTMFLHATESTPIYSAHFCSNGTRYQPNSTFQSNLNTLLSSLISNSSLEANNGFYQTSVAKYTPDDIDGFFLCRGDVNATVCHDCITAAATNLTRFCPNNTESYIWYDVCMLSYSNSTFDNDIKVPAFSLRNERNIDNSSLDQFNEMLSSLINSLASKAEASSTAEKKFGAGEVSLWSTHKLYGMAQCRPDLTSANCETCLRSAIAGFPECCNGSEGARALLPACTIRYELYPFLYYSTLPLVPSPSSGSKSTLMVLAIVIPIAIFAALLVLASFWLRRRRNKTCQAVLELNDSIREFLTSDEESLHFHLSTIEAATNNFSNDLKIGEGGFGVVYKGIFPNGQEIAVKRLSRTSNQGDIEFRNEAALAWNNWRNQTPFLILDPKLNDSYSRNEVQRCIHIALLCVQENPVDRPSMANILLALDSYSVTLALPRQPASVTRGRTTPDRLKHQPDSDRSTSSSLPFSTNDSLITQVFPR
ncbi:hypothetical protein VNO78_19290 [Psophocarpus tetragonolobus]|uniref:Gnk2-homologous domain-containing protein n=1 Tax=Psophocarpus tetragonolobus TaxID=3891 RepID=A0AAN9XFT0_PSOTE